MGADILRLIRGFILVQNGYRVRIIDEHAVFYRKDSLKMDPFDRFGWKFFDGPAESNEFL